jgi:hypothetical protein
MFKGNKQRQWKRRRLSIAFIGFLVGIFVGIPITYLIYGWHFNMTTISFGFAGAALALFYAEKKNRLPRAEDVKAQGFSEQLAPLSLRLSKRDSKLEKKRRQ